MRSSPFAPLTVRSRKQLHFGWPGLPTPRLRETPYAFGYRRLFQLLACHSKPKA